MIFKKMDLDGDGQLTVEEAAKYFKSFVRLSPLAPTSSAPILAPGAHHR